MIEYPSIQNSSKVKTYIQNTKWNNLRLEHPVGKYFISFLPDHKGRIINFLLEKQTDGWLTSGLPQRNPSARLVTRPNQAVPLRDIWYFNTREEVVAKLKSLSPDWREAQNAYVVTQKGFRLIKKGNSFK